MVDHQMVEAVVEHNDIQITCLCGKWAWYVPHDQQILAHYGLRAYDKHVKNEEER